MMILIPGGLWKSAFLTSSQGMPLLQYRVAKNMDSVRMLPGFKLHTVTTKCVVFSKLCYFSAPWTYKMEIRWVLCKVNNAPLRQWLWGLLHLGRGEGQGYDMFKSQNLSCIFMIFKDANIRYWHMFGFSSFPMQANYIRSQISLACATRREAKAACLQTALDSWMRAARLGFAFNCEWNPKFLSLIPDSTWLAGIQKEYLFPSTCVIVATEKAEAQRWEQGNWVVGSWGTRGRSSGSPPTLPISAARGGRSPYLPARLLGSAPLGSLPTSLDPALGLARSCLWTPVVEMQPLLPGSFGLVFGETWELSVQRACGGDGPFPGGPRRGGTLRVLWLPYGDPCLALDAQT